MGSWFSKPWDPTTGIPNLHGKVAIVTGANTGIGYATVEQLARHGAQVYLAARSEAKANAAIEKLYEENQNLEKGKVVFLPLDLADLDHVVKAAEIFLGHEDRLDILVNNAGLISHSFQTTAQGFEIATGVNHVGHFLLTVKLLPLLKATASKRGSDVRVVTVSSRAHTRMPPDVYFDKLDDFKFRGSKPSPNGAGIRNLFSRYAVSKLANLLFAKSLQQHMDAENIPIISTSLHPGFVYTKGSAGIFPGWMEPVSWLLGSSPAQGAAPGLYLATAPDVKKDPRSFKGLYFDTSCKAVTTSALARDPQMAENLWKLSEEAVAEYTAPGANLKSGKHS